MAIKFFCSCGKRLRARDEMAARRSVCPRCGSPVGIPSLQPTHPGVTAGPMSPAERLRVRQNARGLRGPGVEGQGPGVRARSASEGATAPLASASGSAPRPPTPEIVRQLVPHGLPSRSAIRRRAWQLETQWYQCLLYPCRAWPLVLGLAAALAGLTGFAALVLPELVSEAQLELPWLVLVAALWLLAPFLIVGYACGFLDCVLASAAAGEVRHIRWPGRNLLLVLKSTATWLVCFVAGPVVPAGAGLVYWINCGDPGLLDWLILAELGTLAISYWLLTLLAVSQRDRLLDANPVQVVKLVHRLGHRSVAVAAGASVLAITHGVLMFLAVEDLHRNLGAGSLLLAACWLSAMYWATFLLRLLGVWCSRSRS